MTLSTGIQLRVPASTFGPCLPCKVCSKCRLTRCAHSTLEPLAFAFCALRALYGLRLAGSSCTAVPSPDIGRKFVLHRGAPSLGRVAEVPSKQMAFSIGVWNLRAINWGRPWPSAPGPAMRHKVRRIRSRPKCAPETPRRGAIKAQIPVPATIESGRFFDQNADAGGPFSQRRMNSMIAAPRKTRS